MWRAADEVMTAYKLHSLEYGKACCMRRSLRLHKRESGYNCLSRRAGGGKPQEATRQCGASLRRAAGSVPL